MPQNETKIPGTRVASIDLSAFVKLAYLVIGCAVLIYFAIEMRHGWSLAVAAENASMGMLYGVAGLIIVFGVAVVGSSLRKQ